MLDIDYSLYLVTGRELLPHGKDYLTCLEESLQGGVTIVQIREKNAETAEFIQIAKASKEICDRYNVPLLINDRVDVALAMGAHGVHLGQSDMPIAEARRILPVGSIIGISCNSVSHAKIAVQNGADYIGIGAIYGTQTKKLTSPLVGVRGVGPILEVLDGTGVKAVAIGGIKSTNVLRVLYGSVSKLNRSLNGVAVVSDIMGSPEPRFAAERLSKSIRAFNDEASPRPASGLYSSGGFATERILEGVVRLMERVRQLNPLVHQITNNVVATQSANVTLSLGGSPIMATEPQEMEDLAQISGSLLVNIGTMGSAGKEGMQKAGFFANSYKKPVIFDPVGVGASAFRKQCVKEFLDLWQASVIKGNAGELAALAGSDEVDSKGVDSTGPGFRDPVTFVRELAKKERCVVILTGATDYVSDGISVVSLKNGHEILGRITGSGCILGSIVATYCAAANSLETDSNPKQGKLVYGDMFLGSITGVLVLTVAAELAVQRADVQGPGTFLPGLIDILWTLESKVLISLAKVTIE